MLGFQSDLMDIVFVAFSDNCSVGATERKAAVLEFSEFPAVLHSSSLSLDEGLRCSEMLCLREASNSRIRITSANKIYACNKN